MMAESPQFCIDVQIICSYYSAFTCCHNLPGMKTEACNVASTADRPPFICGTYGTSSIFYNLQSMELGNPVNPVNVCRQSHLVYRHYDSCFPGDRFFNTVGINVT